jgi:error-prone DNA polymerase
LNGKVLTDTMENHFGHAGFDLEHPRIAKYLELSDASPGSSAASGAALWRHGDLPGQLDSVVPLEPASMPGRVVVQWDKDDCADMGIVKVDLLGLGMMAVLKTVSRWCRSITANHSTWLNLPQDDPEVYRTLQQADTVGMFQVESRAQMSALPRNLPRTVL